MKLQRHRSPIIHVKSPAPVLSRQPETVEVERSASPIASPRRWRLLRRLCYGLVGIGLVTGTVLALKPAPIPVDLGQVKRGTLQVTVDAEGKTRLRDRFMIAAPVEGRLSRVALEVGDRVKQGQVIAHIERLPLDTKVKAAQARLRELRAQLAGVATQRPKPAALDQAQAQIAAATATQARAQAQVEAAQAALDQAQRDRQRAQDLESQGAIARQQRENAELEATRRQRELEVAQHQVQAAIAEVAAARQAHTVLEAEQKDPDYLLDVYRQQMASVEAELANLSDEASRTEIRAPSDGSVLKVQQESARFVQAGEPLLEVGNPAKLELVVDVLSTDAVKVQPGTSIRIEHWGGEDPLLAQVSYIEPSAFTEVSALGVEEQRVNVIANFVNPPVPLGDGYRVEARIVVWEGQEVLKVPLSALFRCEDQAWCTFVAADGQAQRRQVQIAQRSEFEAVVQAGLKSGEQVILHPTEAIQPGKRVASRT